MNRFLQRGQLQTIESNKDTSVIEDMDTLANEVTSDELLGMVQQEGSSKDLVQAIDMVENSEDDFELMDEVDHSYDYDDYDSFDDYDDD